MRVVKGPALLLAVPGSGKTTTLIARIGYMIHCNRISPDKILVLTYTNAATNDMRERYISIFGSDAPIRFQTINSFCNGVLRDFELNHQIRIPRLMEDTNQLVTKLYQEVYHEYPSEGELSETKQTIAYIKNMQLPEDEIGRLKVGEHTAIPLFSAYQNYMRKNGRMDFDDQILLTQKLFQANENILRKWQDTYPYILVDEAQDTSKCQHEVIRMIASKYQNIFMVGDEDQSIYGFRAAYPQALLEFESQYTDARVLLLEQNYRSTPQIVKTAKGFIEKNKKRKQKEMFTERPDGPEVRFVSFDNRHKQYGYLLNQLRQSKEKTAVLYRNNDSAVPLIYCLQNAGVPYSGRGVDTVFFSHKVVKDVRLFFAFVNNPTDPDLFLNLYYKTALRIKKEHAVKTIHSFDPQTDRTLWHTYRRLFADNAFLRKNADKVISEIDALRNDDAGHAIRRIQYRIRNIDSAEEEKFNILLFLTNWQESRDRFIAKLDWLEQIIRNGSKDPRGIVTLSTVHSSKGLEYENVFIVDAIEGVLPSADSEDLEEERRVFYVAMTRAKDCLTILRYSDCKMPFVDAVDPNRTVLKTVGGPKNNSHSPKKKPGPGLSNIPTAKKKKRILGVAEGDIVTHRIEGRGKVKRLTQTTITVKFNNGLERTFDTKSAITKGIIEKV